MSPNVLEEMNAMEGQKKWRSDLRPGKKRKDRTGNIPRRRENIQTEKK